MATAVPPESTPDAAASGLDSGELWSNAAENCVDGSSTWLTAIPSGAGAPAKLSSGPGSWAGGGGSGIVVAAICAKLLVSGALAGRTAAAEFETEAERAGAGSPPSRFEVLTSGVEPSLAKT